jgi:prolyl 4-hydroxylase
MIKEIENFIDKAEADHLVYLIDKFAHKSTVVGNGQQHNKFDTARTSYSATLDSKNPTIKRIHQRIARYLGVPITKGEVLQGQRYQKGQYFREHPDYFTGEHYDMNCLASGNRTYTFMLYLNDDFKGGTTNFKHLKREIKPQAYKAVVWNNLHMGKPDPYKLHSGEEVLEGTKYIVTSWWRENNWNGSDDYKEYKKKLNSNQLSII